MKKTSVPVAEAKRRFSELIGRVAHAGERITITRRGKPVVVMAPCEPLSEVEGWLEDDDPFFAALEERAALRRRHPPRATRRRRA